MRHARGAPAAQDTSAEGPRLRRGSRMWTRRSGKKEVNSEKREGSEAPEGTRRTAAGADQEGSEAPEGTRRTAAGAERQEGSEAPEGTRRTAAGAERQGSEAPEGT